MKRKLKTGLVLFCLFLSLGEAMAATRIIHVFVALCDNDSQGIVPVPKKIGNGNDPDNNLYWGCGYGVRTYFKNAKEWKTVASIKNPRTNILERLIFKHKVNDTWLVADGYRGSNIKECTVDFLNSSSGNSLDTITVNNGTQRVLLQLTLASLVCYVGHDGLMDFSLDVYPKKKGTDTKQTIIMACVSKSYFKSAIKEAGATPLLWTTGLMCPEAYSLHAAINGWIANETAQQVRVRAAEAYHLYQKCGIRGAMGLFATGW